MSSIGCSNIPTNNGPQVWKKKQITIIVSLSSEAITSKQLLKIKYFMKNKIERHSYEVTEWQVYNL